MGWIIRGSCAGMGWEFLFTTTSKLVLQPTQPPIKSVEGALSLGVKRTGCEADHSPPYSAEVKNAWSYTSTPTTPSWHGAQLKCRNNFTFYLLPFTIYCLIYYKNAQYLEWL
jgi:hypothetical protein